MKLYYLSDSVRAEGKTGRILETQSALTPVRADQPVRLVAPAFGYQSFQIVLDTKSAGDISVHTESACEKVSAEVFAEWFHVIGGEWVPDCLIPVKENGVIPSQDSPEVTISALWVDVYVDKRAEAGEYPVKVVVTKNGKAEAVNVCVEVPKLAYPETGKIICDLNNYADSISNQYESLKSNPDRYVDGSYIEVEQAYFRMAREHRCLFHNLPYRHSGKITKGYAPELEGEGKDIRVKDWSLFDRHFAPLLTGEAFKGSRVSEKPLEYMYLPFHLGWPANYEKWGQKGYRTEYRRILAEFVKHFEEKGWYTTKLELFLNHKKDYRFYPYTADEIWYLHDEEAIDKWHEVIEGVCEHTRVPFIGRLDSSNYFGAHHDKHRFADWFQLWVAGKAMFNWYPESVAAFRNHGNTLWIYGGVLRDLRTSLLSLYEWPMECMMTGADGFCVWNTTNAGQTPFKTPYAAGAEMLFYPGERFGVHGPLPCIRLKTLRNAMQAAELALELNRDSVHKAVNSMFGFDGDGAWWKEKPPFIDTPPRYWDFGEKFDDYTVPPLYLGRQPAKLEEFRNGMVELAIAPPSKAAEGGFRYY